MLLDEISNIVTLIRKNDIVRNVAVFIISFSIFVALVFSFLAAIIIFASYLLGFVVCWILTRYITCISIYLHRFVSFYREHVSIRKENSNCTVCDGGNCKRQRLHSSTPWKELYISTELNDASEHFFNRILGEFVSNWYKDFTTDTAFITELQVAVRYASATLINKLLKSNPSNIIAKKLIPTAVKHVDDYLCMRQIAKLKNVTVNEVAVEYLGRRLHIAVTKRDNELSYLRHLTAGILPYILPPESLKCRNFFVLMREILAGWVLLPLMDILADPNMINSLVILITTHKSKGVVPHNSQCIVFLHNFTYKNVRNSSFNCDLRYILKTTDLFYVFMQFLKKTGPVHILQFLLDIEDFNNKLLMPDMSKKQLEVLHSKASNLYKIYFDSKSSEFIGCSSKIQLQLLQLLQDGVYNVAKLRTSEPLYQAYDYAFALLENDWLPDFFHSNEFYSYICGSKVVATYNKASSNIKLKKFENTLSQGTVSKISSSLDRIKGVLKPNQPIEGAVYPGDFQIYSNGPTEFVEDILMPECEDIFRDLSAWRISIPSVEIQQVTGSKPSYLFNISIQRIDTLSKNEIKHWLVQRKDQDFHTLKTKLIEFHGENEICDSSLPSRRSTTSVELRRFKYEEFLRSLLQKHSLRGSDLLHTFLTTDQDFTIIVTTTLPVVEDLGNIYQSVAFKLRKEKGQHLDPFVNNFLISTLKPKPSKFEWGEIGDEIEITVPCNNKSDAPATFASRVFNNNFNVSKKNEVVSSSSSFNPSGITESLFYLLYTFKIRQSVLKLYAAICSVAQDAVELFCKHYLERKLHSSLSHQNLADLVVFLEDAIFDSHTHPTKDDLLKRKETAFKELQQFVPHLMDKILGPNFTCGLLDLLEILQNPLCNKQLAYTLLDIVVAELFPELEGKEGC